MSRCNTWGGVLLAIKTYDSSFCALQRKVSTFIQQVEHYCTRRTRMALIWGQLGKAKTTQQSFEATYQGAHPAQGPGRDHDDYSV